MKYDPSRETIVCIDLSVALHQLEEALLQQPLPYGLLEGMVERGEVLTKREAELRLLKQLTKLNMDWLVSLDWLGELKPDKYRVVLLRDWKINYRISKDTHVLPDGASWDVGGEMHDLWGYWRHEYLKRLDVAAKLDAAKPQKRTRRVRDANGNLVDKVPKTSGVSYKAGRAHSSNNFKCIKAKTQTLTVANDWATLGFPGYEADDIAGSLVRLNEQLVDPYQLLLVTTDTDWLGLVNDNVYWFCMFGWYPRLRDTEDILEEWSTRRLKKPCRTGQDIYEHKSVNGDTSDNLPGGCPEVIRGVVDLLQPLPEYDLLTRSGYEYEMKQVFKPGVTSAQVDGFRVQELLERIGLKPFIREFEASRDYPGTFTSVPPADLF